MATPTVSIIVPNYNHARYLRKRVDSILAQTYQDFELILLDDCSTDESRSILCEYSSDSRARLEFNEVNSGTPFKQWNKGLRLARGKYAWIAESDDYADSHLLERLVRVLDADPNICFAYCRSQCVSAEDRALGFVNTIYFPDLDPNRWAKDFRADGREECRTHFVRSNTASNASAVVFRKAVYEVVGGADESLTISGDWKLWAAMAFRGDVAYISDALNYYRFHGATSRATGDRDGRTIAEPLQVIRWIMARVRPADELLESLCDILCSHWISAVLSTHVPLRRKWSIILDVLSIDPHPVRRFVRTAPSALRKSGRANAAWLCSKLVWVIRNCVWHPILDGTRPIRHSTGLNLGNVRVLFKRLRIKVDELSKASRRAERLR